MNQLPYPNLIEERGACLVVNKPGGLLTQGPPGIDSLELRIKQFLKQRDHKPGKVYLGVPHRLDRPAAGIMVFAKNVRAAKRIADQFQKRQVRKIYWAVVQGHLENDFGRMTDQMKKLPDEAKSVIVEPGDPEGQHAELEYRVLSRQASTSWLEIQLHTGRTHQIRLQMGSRGHPILGDQLYGSDVGFGPETKDVRKRWIALHAREIGFEHPVEHVPILLQAPLWNHWRALDIDFGCSYVIE